MERQSLAEFFKSARRVSTPILGIVGPDPQATMDNVQLALKGFPLKVPYLRWDLIRGLVGLNEIGRQLVQVIAGKEDVLSQTQNLADCLNLISKLPGEDKASKTTGAIVFVWSAHRFIANEAVAQAVNNLRDQFKQNRRTLVLLGPDLQLPIELRENVIVYEEALPGDKELEQVVLDQCNSARLPKPEEPVLVKAVDALRGLSAFPAEQVTAMSLTKEGIDLEALWSRKKSTIEQTRGLNVDREILTFDDIGGLSQVKKFFQALMSGENPYRVIVRMEELEKMMAGIGGQFGPGDSSGVSTDQLGVILNAMEDFNWPGIIALGPPGSGKSLLSKALASTFKKLSISLDLGAMKGSYVGESEAQIRAAIRVLHSVAGPGGLLVQATCNKLEVLPPELRRRFRLGIWFFDLPSEEERGPIWKINLKKYGLPEDAERPPDQGLTGAEIRNICDIAWRLKCSLVEAAKYVVPVSVSDPESIQKLRRMANGRFLSVSYEGCYNMDWAIEENAPKDRAIDLEEPSKPKASAGGYL